MIGNDTLFRSIPLVCDIYKKKKKKKKKRYLHSPVKKHLYRVSCLTKKEMNVNTLCSCLYSRIVSFGLTVA
jgi:hypothetical protein